MTQTNPVVWFEIYVADIERAKAFYGTMLAVEFQRIGDPNIQMWGFPSTAGAAGAPGALVQMEGVTPGGGTLVYFHCEDCAIEEARIEAAGGKIFRSKMSIGPNGFISLGIDTEGNMFGLHSIA